MNGVNKLSLAFKRFLPITLLFILFAHVTHAQPLVTGLRGSAGSAVGPDGYLYVTEGMTGTVQRINVATGEVSLFAEGLPPWIIGVGGAVDIAFIDDTAYVLVTLVNLFGEPSGLSTVFTESMGLALIRLLPIWVHIASLMNPTHRMIFRLVCSGRSKNIEAVCWCLTGITIACCMSLRMAK